MEYSALTYCKIPKSKWQERDYFVEYFNSLSEIVQCQYTWDMPDTCSTRELERTIFFEGSALILQDRVNPNNFYTLPYTAASRGNMYNIPPERVATARTGWRQKCNADNSVIVYGSYNRWPNVYTVAHYAAQLAHIKTIQMVNVENQATPYLISGSQAQTNSLKKLYEQVTSGKPAVFVDKDLDTELLRVFGLSVPERYLSLQELFERVWNECLVRCGIATVNTWKKERLVGTEADATIGQSVASRMGGWLCRQQAVKNLKRRFPGFAWACHYALDEEGDIYGAVYTDGNRPAGGTDGAGVSGDVGGSGYSDSSGSTDNI